MYLIYHMVKDFSPLEDGYSPYSDRDESKATNTSNQ